MLVEGINKAAFEQALEEVAFALKSVPFFSEYLFEQGLRPTDVRDTTGFAAIRPTTKIEYRRNFPRGVLAAGKTLNDPHILTSKSSGTGGERLTTVTHTFLLARRARNTLRANKPLLEALTAPRFQSVARYAPPNCSDVECATPFSTMEDRMLADGTLVLPVSHDLLATPPAMVNQAIDEIDKLQPHWLYVDPTHLAFLIRSMGDRGLSDVGAVVLTYTLCTGVARRQICASFEPTTPMAEIVSMSEFGWLAIECPVGNMHINNLDFFLEFWSGSRPTRPGELGELLVTSLGDRLLPHIRYRTGDIYRLGEHSCACKSTLPIVRHEGRLPNMLKFKTPRGLELLSPRDVSDLIGQAEGIDLYRLDQRSDGGLQLRYVGDADPDSLEVGDIVDRLRGRMPANEKIEVKKTHQIECGRSGKFVSCSSEIALELDDIRTASSD